MDFLNKMREMYPLSVNQNNEIMIMVDNGKNKFVDYNPNYRENILFSATYGKNISIQNYEGFSFESITPHKNRTDLTVFSLSNTVIGVTENAISENTSNFKNILYSKIAQGFNYLLEYYNNSELDNDIVHLTINVYNPDIFLSKKNNFISFLDSEGLSPEDRFSTFGIFGITFSYHISEWEKHFQNVNFNNISKDYIIDNYLFFDIEDKQIGNNCSYIYLDYGAIASGDFIDISKSSFSYIADINKLNIHNLNKITNRSSSYGGTHYSNNRGLDFDEVLSKEKDILEKGLDKLIINEFNLSKPELFKIGWNDRVVRGSINKLSLSKKDGEKLFLMSPDMEKGNGQTSSEAIMRIKEESSSDIQSFKKYIKRFRFSSVDSLNTDDKWQKFQEFLLRFMPKIQFDFSENPKNGELQNEINNNIKGQSGEDKAARKNKSKYNMISAKLHQENKIPGDVSIINSSSHMDDRSFRRKDLYAFNLSNINILKEAHVRGYSFIGNKNKLSFLDNQEFIDMFSTLNLNMNLLEYYFLNEAISTSERGKQLRKEGYSTILNEYTKEGISRKKEQLKIIEDRLSLISEEKIINEKSRKASTLFLKRLLKELYSIKKNMKINEFKKFVEEIEFFLKMDVYLDEGTLNKIKQNLTSIEMSVDTESISVLINIDLYFQKHVKNNLFTESNNFKVLCSFLIGLNQEELNLENIKNMINKLSVLDIKLSKLRRTKIEEFTSDIFITFDEAFCGNNNPLKYKGFMTSNKSLIHLTDVIIKLHSEKKNIIEIRSYLKKNFNEQIAKTEIHSFLVENKLIKLEKVA